MQGKELYDSGEIPLILIFLEFFFSFLYLATGYRLLFDLLPWFFLVCLGSSLTFSRPRDWWFLLTMSVLGFSLAFFTGIGSGALVYLAILVFVSLVYIYLPKQVSGVVLLANDKLAVVEINDFLAGFPKGLYVARGKKGIRKGPVILEARKWGERLRILRRQENS